MTILTAEPDGSAKMAEPGQWRSRAHLMAEPDGGAPGNDAAEPI